MNEGGRLLRKADILSDLDDDSLRVIESRLREHTLQPGQELFKEGDKGNEMFIVREGGVGISVRLTDGNELRIAEFGPGDFFGEMSIFENEPRSATCTADQPSTLWSLHQYDLSRFAEEAPEAATRVLGRMLSITRKRLETSNRFLSDMVQWGEEARKRAITDGMTGLYNRRYLDDVIVESFDEARERDEPLSLIMVDLDRFREINDQFSPAIGDQAIMNAVTVFKANLREGDIPARYGGDEFTFVLPRTTAEEAAKIAVRICAQVRALDVLPPSDGLIRRVTTSQGLACFPEHAENLADLRGAADRALYAAKEAGRDRVVVASVVRAAG